MRTNHVQPRFLEFIPNEREDGVVYISIEYGAIVHSCCCGCGEKVSTPLSPAQWSFTFDGEHISLSPSVGSGTLPCSSHYVITRNEVRWVPKMTKAQTTAALNRDRAVLAEHLESVESVVAEPERWWRRIPRWFRR